MHWYMKNSGFTGKRQQVTQKAFKFELIKKLNVSQLLKKFLRLVAAQNLRGHAEQFVKSRLWCFVR